MKANLTKFLFLLSALFSFFYESRANVIETIKFSQDDFRIETMGNGKCRVRANDALRFCYKPNKLFIPIRECSFMLPYGSIAKSISVSYQNKTKILSEVELDICPNELPASINSRPIQSQYSSDPIFILDEFNKLNGTNFWGTIPIAGIQLSPFIYENRNLYIVEQYSIDIELESYNPDTNFNSNFTEIRNELQHIVDNPDEISPLLSQIPAYSSESDNNIDYLIITSEDLKDSFDSLLEWKRKKGLRTALITIKDIQDNNDGYDLVEKIKDCIATMYKEHQLKYVLLGGDNKIIPVRYCQLLNRKTTASKDRYPTDMYYACFDKNFQWDSDGDEYYGTFYDDISANICVYISRLPIRTAEDVINYTTKLIAYERGYNSKNWNYNILMTGALLGIDNRKDITETDRLMSDAENHADMIYENSIQPYWNGRRVKFFDTYTDFEEGADYPLHPDNLQIELSKSPMFVSMLTHGSSYCWGLEDWHCFEYDSNGDFIRDNEGKKIEHQNYEYLYNKDLASEIVAPYYTLITTIACNTNMFDDEDAGIDEKDKDPCFSEVLIRGKENGIIGYLGNSRDGYYYPGMNYLGSSERFEGIFYETLLNSATKDKNFGKIVALAKTTINPLSYRSLTYPLNPIGDPEMPIFTEIPKDFDDLCIYLYDNLSIETGTEDAIISIIDNTKSETIPPTVYIGKCEIYPPQDATICITKQNYKPRVYQVIASEDLLDFYQEIPLKEGYEKIHVAQLYPNMYQSNNSDNINNIIIVSASYRNGMLHIELEGEIREDTQYILTLRNILGNISVNKTITQNYTDIHIDNLESGLYILELRTNGMRIDSTKLYVK